MLFVGLEQGARPAPPADRPRAEGTAHGPGDRIVLAEQAGILLTIAEKLRPEAGSPPDVRTVEQAAANAPWMIETIVRQ